MNILMFGWEFPPNISGGLGTACYGITKSLAALDTKITFVIPKVYGNEPHHEVKLIGANQVDLIKSKIHTERLFLPIDCLGVESRMIPYTAPEEYQRQYRSSREKQSSKSTSSHSPAIQFTGSYGSGLMAEIHNFSIIAEYIASRVQFDVIHAHDWLTFPAGIAAQKVSGKPLVVHVHATDFDRSGFKVNPQVFEIEQKGMHQADCIICVSNRTRQTVIDKYKIPASKTQTVYNGVEFSQSSNQLSPGSKGNNKIVTFLGRITLQKGPEYFIRVAELVLSKMNNVNFIMAGSGDLHHEMIRKVACSHIADRFFFPGFLKGKEVCRMMKLSDVFIMPSVSEPFGICPLEAMQNEVPTIISKQSGVSEIVKHTIKVDFWDVHAMADAIHALLSYPAIAKMMTKLGKQESGQLRWEQAAAKIQTIYHDLVRVKVSGLPKAI
ncbi:glycosyltransferase family 4 protein [Sunxiuqinia sp. sy24]|uniref:glycosyltransferase family 4 protein n=1 Tax=Sunxiuqinia sp. sy24 TaxID=3461495 RepID=UPI004046172B